MKQETKMRANNVAHIIFIFLLAALLAGCPNAQFTKSSKTALKAPHSFSEGGTPAVLSNPGNKQPLVLRVNYETATIKNQKFHITSYKEGESLWSVMQKAFTYMKKIVGVIFHP